MKRLLSAATIAVGAIWAGAVTPASADPLFGIGSDFTVFGTAAGTSFDNTAVVFNPGTQLIAPNLDLTIKITPDPSTAQSEWVTLTYTTANGGQLTPGGGFFQLETVGIPTVVATNFIGDASQWFAGSTVLTQTGTTGLFGQTLMPNPVPGGPAGQAEATLGFVSPFPVGPLPQLGAFADDLGFDLGNHGVDVTTVTGFSEALQFDPQQLVPPPSVPEPSSIALLGVGVLGAGFVARRKRSE
jgi:PEP-CTERM motif